MNLSDLTTSVLRISDLYAAEHGIERSGDWALLKVQEELGELTAEHLRMSGRARGEADAGKLGDEAADVFLGVPFNIASYALLTMMVAQVCGLKPGEFVHTFGDAHLYLNHVEQAETQLARAPLPAPTMTITPRDDLFAYTLEDFVLEGYEPWPHIKAPVAV